MTLTQILVFSAISFFAGWLLPIRWRVLGLMSASLVAVFWLQPSTPIRNLDFWLPVASIVLTVFVWSVTQSKQNKNIVSTRSASLIIIGVVFLIGLTRYVEPICCLTASRPPSILKISTALGLSFVGASIAYWFSRKVRFAAGATIILILALFIILKTEPLTLLASTMLREWAGQSGDLASAMDIPWLGFSYLAFRLIHTLRDHQLGKLPPYTLGEFVSYAIFFPTYTAGPIDRSQRFIQELSHPTTTMDADKTPDNNKTGITTRASLEINNIGWGGYRIIWGIFKKFVLADSLALIALSSQNALQVSSSGWMWILLYAYALRIYFDFSGYTDIALGLGRLLGFKLPENFNHPYLKRNLTTFWNSWHITLAQWFRAYFFNPITRSMRSRKRQLPAWAMIIIAQLSTMLLIGLWHGVTWNFAIWGLWHGVGLFVHNRWTNWSRPWLASMDSHPILMKFSNFTSWFVTINYVVLGWVWFALPDPELALKVFQVLFHSS